MAPEGSVLAVRGSRAGGGGAEVSVALGEGLFAGHFPGRPTLPAIGQLAVVEAAVGAWRGEPVRLQAVEGVRLTRRVEGGEVTVRLEPVAEGSLRFTLLAGDEVASTGRVSERAEERAPDPGSDAPGVGRPDLQQERPVPKLPHAGVARMLSRVLGIDGDALLAEAALGPGSAFAGLGRPTGSAPAWVALEMAAQAAAALELADLGGDAGARLGYLVRLRRVHCRRPSLPVATPLRLAVARTAAVATLRTYEALASLDGETLVTAELSLFFDEPAG